MKLPFQYQFILAPLITVVVLATLVGYTLIEFAHISRQNDSILQWVVATDRIQATMAGMVRVQRITRDLSAGPATEKDELLFEYLEQSKILSDMLTHPDLLERLPGELRHRIEAAESLLHEPEHVNPVLLLSQLDELLPAMEYQYRIFQSHRRAAYVDYHRSLSVINPRVTTVLLSGLVVCILLALGLAVWGLRSTRQRLDRLSQCARDACSGELVALAAPATPRDEIDELEVCLAKMTQRLVNVVAVEKVLQGAESERRRIAMDMHDGVLADLTAISRRLDNPALRISIDDVINAIRRTIDDLHPQTLDILGLESAVRSFLDRHGSIQGTPACHFQFDAAIEGLLHPSQKLNLFRITTEAVNNVLRHARCSRFEVTFRIHAHQLILSIEDNGVGMPPSPAGGHGRANIAERARILGASISWRPSRFASGVCVEIVLPLEMST